MQNNLTSYPILLCLSLIIGPAIESASAAFQGEVATELELPMNTPRAITLEKNRRKTGGG